MEEEGEVEEEGEATDGVEGEEEGQEAEAEVEEDGEREWQWPGEGAGDGKGERDGDEEIAKTLKEHAPLVDGEQGTGGVYVEIRGDEGRDALGEESLLSRVGPTPTNELKRARAEPVLSVHLSSKKKKPGDWNVNTYQPY